MGRPKSGCLGPLSIVLFGFFFGGFAEFSITVWAWVAAWVLTLVFVVHARKNRTD